jgi:hypothetical protein
LNQISRYLQVHSQGVDWFWYNLTKAIPSGIGHDVIVHHAFPNIKCVVERKAGKGDGESNASGRSLRNRRDSGIEVSVSVRNHLNGDASTSKTMHKALAAILRHSEKHSQTPLEEYVDEIASLPDFTMQSAAKEFSISREVYMKRSRKVAASSPILSRMPPGLAEESMRKLYDAHESGNWDHLPPAAKPSFYLSLQQITASMESLGFLLNLEEIGAIYFRLMLNKSSPNAQCDLVTVVNQLFLQIVVLFTTPTNLECYGPMIFKLHCYTFLLAEQWIDLVSGF